MVPALWAGLLAGALATAAMTLWELPFYLRHGMEGVLEWHENQATASRLLGRPAESLVAAGLGLHVAHGALAGVVYGYVWVQRLLVGPWLSAVAGLAFGWGFWLVTLALHRPLTGTSAIDHPLGTRPAEVSLVGHAIYGIVLGALVPLL